MTSLIIIILFILLLLCIGYILYLKYFKKYTRERFAFMGVTVMSLLFSTLLLQIYSSQGYISAFVNTSNFLFSTKLSSYQTDWKDHLLTLLGFSYFMQFIYKLHKNWDGPISEIHYDRNRFHENSTMLQEAILQLKDFLSKEKKILPHKNNKEIKNFNIFASQEADKMPWHENVFELLTFNDAQYKIDLYNDYYRDEKCFITKYGLINNYIAILCLLDFPDDTTIRAFISFADSHKLKLSKYIIAVKNYEGSEICVNKFDKEITIRGENEMLDSLIDLTPYEQFIKEQFTSREIANGSGKTLKENYVHLQGKSDNEEPIGEIELYVANWLKETEGNKHLALLAEYGCGKSVVSLKMTYELLENRQQGSRIPILIELRGKSPRNLNVTEILSTWGAPYRIDAASLLKLHKAGKLLIIFEGFDEMDMIGDKEMRLNHFQRLWEFAISKSKIIITGRPNFFLDDKELKTNLGIYKPFESSHYCEAIYIEKFNLEQIKLALRNVDQNTKEQVLFILNESSNSNFYDLVSRPAILHLVAVIWKDRKLAELKENINSAIVISEFIKYSYARQSDKSNEFPLSEREREYFMLGIAVFMFSNAGGTNQIKKEDLENLILKLYKKFPEEITSFQSAIQPNRRPLKERMRDNNQAEDSVLTDVRSCGILVNDLARKDYFKFAHKSYLEYQASLYFVESLVQDKGDYNIIMNAITNSLNIVNSEFKHTEETIAFTSEILISKLKFMTPNEPHKVCKLLFIILYPYKFIRRHPYLATIFDLILVPKSPIIFLFILIIVSFFSVFIPYSHTGNEQYLLLNLAMRMSIIVPFVALMYYQTINRKKIIRRFNRMSIWLMCCKQLNISDKVILQVVPKFYLTMIRTDKFDRPLTLFISKLISLFSGRKNTGIDETNNT